MTDTLFLILFTATWQSILLAIFVLLIVFMFRERLSPRFRYLLWCVVLLRLALPILPVTPWGVLPNEKNQTEILIANAETVLVQWTPPPELETQPFPATLVSGVVEIPVKHETNEPKVTPLNREQVFAYAKLFVLAVWFGGIVILGIRYVLDEIRLYRQSRYWKPITDPELQNVFQSCCRQLGIRWRVRLLAVSHKIGAASAGAIFPKVLLSEQVVSQQNQRRDTNQLRLVILHELVHLKRFDPLMLRVSVILNIIHWLNPVAWLVMSRLQRDRELACDATVLHILDSHDTSGTAQKDYGEAVLTFATLFSPREHLPGLVGLFPKHAISRRIDMILKYRKTNFIYTIFGALLVLIVAAFGLTRAAEKVQKASPKNETKTTAKPDTTDGVCVEGRVTDSAGKPVENALVLWFTEPNDYWDNRKTAVKTDAEGRYRSPELKPVEGGITVIAEGFAPEVKEVEFKANMKPVDFSLKPGKTLEIHFVDPDGKPIPGVKLQMGGNPDSWWKEKSNIYTGYSHYNDMPDTKIPSQADENGVYRWNWAPEGKVHFMYSCKNYLTSFSDEYPSENWVTPGEKVDTIVLYPQITVKGTVVDDETGKPIEKFRVFRGNIHPNFYPGGIIWQPGAEDNSSPEGTFEYVFEYYHKNGYRIRVDATGYDSAETKDILPGKGDQKFELRLKKNAGQSAVVLLPDGSPAAGTKVFVSGSGGYLQVSTPPNSYLTQRANLTTTTDDKGRFTLYMQPDDRFGIYLEHPKGLGWMKSNDFRQGKEAQLHGFAKKLEIILPESLISAKEVWISISPTELGNDGFGHIDYQKEIRPGMKTADFEGIVAGKYTVELNVPNPEHTWVRGSGSQSLLTQPFEIAEGETKTLDLNQGGTTITGRITLPDSVKERFTARDWIYNYVNFSRTGADGDKIEERKVYLTQSPNDPQSGVFRCENVAEGNWTFLASISQAPKDSDSMDAFTPLLSDFVLQTKIPKQDTPFDVGVMKKYIRMNQETVLIFDDGKWTIEKTGETLPNGTIAEGTKGTFQLEQEDGIGKVVKLAGDGAIGQGEHIKFYNGGNSINVSKLSAKDLKELQEHGLEIGMDDVFVYDNGEWKNEKTQKVIPMGSLVSGTHGVFRLEEENGEGKITLLSGAGAIGKGKYIRWSHGGDAYSGSKP